jgi:Cof subfamily protein (haloacid dehalogenase superfamily)
MKQIALLLADVDGTLVTKDKILTERAQQAVRELAKRGIKFAVTSGRPPRGMSMLIKPLAISTPIAGFNGGLYTDADFKTIAGNTIDPAAARQAAESIEQGGLDVWLYAGEDWLVRDLDAPHVSREEQTVKFPPKVVSRFTDDMFAKVVKIVGVSDDAEKVAGCEKTLQAQLGKTVSAARSQPYYLDVTHPDANKGAVVLYLSRTLGIPTEQIATIGDMPNDVMMFVKSGLSIAMGNASPEVQKQADEVTDDYENEGFAKAVERFILT